MADKLELYAEARKICEQRLGSKALAFQWCARAFEAAPKNEAVRTDLERLAGEADEWGNLAALYDARTAATTDAEERLWLLRRTLRIASTRLFRPQDARKAAEQIIAEVGFDEEADAALEQILTQTKAWADLAKLLHARADRAPDAAERVRLLFRIAQLEEERVVDAAAATVDLEEDPRGGAEQRARAAGADPAVRGAPGLGGRRRGPAARSRVAARPTAARSARRCCCASRTFKRSGSTIRRRRSRRTARCCRRTRTRRRRSRAWNGCWRAATPIAPAIARLTLPFYERTGDAPKLAAANEALLAVADTRGEKVERLEKLRGALRRAGSTIRRAPTASAWRCSTSIPRTRRTATRCSGSRTRRARPASWPRSCAPSRRETEDQTAAPRPAGRRRRAAGEAARARAGRREGLRADPQGGAAARGRVPGAVAPVSRRAALGGAARAARHAPAGRAGRARTAGPARPDRRARRVGAGRRTTTRSPSTRRCWSSTPADLRAHRALDRHYAARERWRDLENLLGTRVGFASDGRGRRSWSSGAPSCAPATSKTSSARSTCWNRSSRSRRTTRARAACSRSWSRCPEQRQRVAKILEPVYEASGAWARLAAILDVEREVAGGPRRRRRCWRASPTCRRTSCRRAARRWRPGGRCWRPIPGNPDALPEIERLGTALERFSELVDVYQELAFKRDAADIAGRADLLSRAAKLYAGRLGNRRAAIDVWKLVLALDPERRRHDGAGGGRAGDALHRDRRRRRPGEDPRACRCAGPPSGAARKKILFRIAELQEKSLSDIDAAVATLRSILEIDPQERDGDRRAGADLRGGLAAPAARRDAAQADRPGRRRGGAPGAVAARRGPARARRRRRRRGDRRVRQHPRREPAGRSGAGDAGAALRAAGAPPRSAWRSSSAGWRSHGRRARRSGVGAAAADRGAAGRAARRSGRRARALARGAGGGARRPRGAGGAGALPGARHRRRAAAGGGAGAGADLRERRAASPSWRRWCASTSRRRPTRARGSSS